MPKRVLSGKVVSSNSNKTIVVQVIRRVKHKLYKKIISRSKKYHAHDPENKYKKGDNVSIIETKPISKLKNWIVINEGLNKWYRCSQTYSSLIIQVLEEFNA